MLVFYDFSVLVCFGFGFVQNLHMDCLFFAFFFFFFFFFFVFV